MVNSLSREVDMVVLVAGARAGEDAAWASLVRRFDRRLRDIARFYGLSASDVDDVVQNTWVALYTHITQLREPAAVAGWLSTTARRESLRVLQGRVRERLSDDPCLGDRPTAADPESELLAAERRDVLAQAMSTLPDAHRRVMVMLASDETCAYKEISATLGISIGCIGAWRGRSVARLQRHPQLRALHASAS